MASKYSYNDVVKRLRQSSTNITCSEMKKMLEDLGFLVKHGTTGNHHRFNHPKILEFHGGKFDGGHKSTVKPCYPRDVLTILEEFESQLNPEQGKAK